MRPLLITLIGSGLLLVGLVPRSAQAQIGTGTGNNLNIEHYRPPASPRGMVTIPESKAQQWREWSVGLFLSYSRNPLVLFQDRLQVGEVVGHRVSADVVGSIGLFKWLEAWVVAPVTFFQLGDENLPTGELPFAGMRDLRLGVKITVATQQQIGLFGIAIVPDISLPTGDAAAFLGDGEPSFTPFLVVDRSFDIMWGIRGTAKVGVRIRPRTEIGNIEVNNELFYKFGGGLGLPPIGDLYPEAVAEFSNFTGLENPFDESEQTPALTTVALKLPYNLDHGHQVVTTGGVSFGNTRGYGSPDFQVFLGVQYRRWLTDRDKDGIVDDDDFCPDDPEDHDGFEDADGCPDPDNDKDGIPDVSDKCPDEPEDADGFEDLDGCPDLDNDKDGIPDKKDSCPNDPEDFDGFEDEDGCPEPDNDLDGIPDDLDKCPTDKETINGVDDEDGCPDEGEEHVEVTSEKITIDTKIHFAFDSAVIKKKSYSILNQVALTMLANPQLGRIRVEGHCDNRGSHSYNLVLSQKRAEAVMEYLIGRGVARERLEAQGYGKTRPLMKGRTEKAWAKNRRVEFTILETGEVETGTRTLEPPPETP